VHNWAQKADLQPTDGASPDHVALDETVIQLNDQRYWLYAAVDPVTNEFLHMKLFSTRMTTLTKIFLQEFTEKHDVTDTVFLIDSAPWLKAALQDFTLRFQTSTYGNRNAVERIVKEINRRKQFSNHFTHAKAETAENWLQSFAFV
jgi:transposase-like protein